MSRPRTEPEHQPNGYEKLTRKVEVECTASEHAIWLTAFGRGKLADTARQLLNKQAYEAAGLPSGPVEKPLFLAKLAKEVLRHDQAIRRILRDNRGE